MPTPTARLALVPAILVAAFAAGPFGAALGVDRPSAAQLTTSAPAASSDTVVAGAASVRDFGAVPNDGRDDTGAFRRALAGATAVHVPAGVYNLGILTVPSGRTVTGVGDASWLKGRVDFRSDDQFTDLRIGKAGRCAVRNVAGASDTTFTRVRFRGGGGTYVDANVVKLDSHPSFITFQSCRFERNLGTENSSHSRHFDNVYITSGTAGPVTHDILFKGCRFGISNGKASGCPRMNVEIWSDSSAGTRTTGFYNIDFEGCTFNAPADENIDYSGHSLSSDDYTPASGYSHVTGCTFRGNGKNYRWWNDIVVEGGAGYVTVTGNTFYRGAGSAAYFEWAVDGHNVFSDNVVDGSNRVFDTGIPHVDNNYVRMGSDDNVVANNTITAPTGYAILLNGTASGNTITGNDLTGGGVRDTGTGNTVGGNY